MINMLSANKILSEMKRGHITIMPMDPQNLGPISYDMSIENKLIEIPATYQMVDDGHPVYPKHNVIDTKDESNHFQKEVIIPEDGIVLFPGILYLATTKEEIWSDTYVPCVSGRSSFARAGIEVHHTSFFANPGHRFKWILEISVTVPIKIYPDSKICQLYFEDVTGSLNGFEYHGKYLDNNSDYGFISE